ncbi:Hypothetical protein HVR_LOCUS607 [uncultured virus]|nr:Hypothetical protein HVR_LOCUS607 [uncultured virus]
MHTYTIERVSLVEDKFYEINSTNGEIYHLLKRDKRFGDKLAIRHGFTNIESLKYFTFVSEIEPFSDAIERLLFAKQFTINNPDAVLKRLIIPELKAGKCIDYKRYDRKIFENYLNYEIETGNIVKDERSRRLKPVGWISKVNTLLGNYREITCCDSYHYHERASKEGFCFKMISIHSSDSCWCFAPTKGVLIKIYL